MLVPEENADDENMGYGTVAHSNFILLILSQPLSLFRAPARAGACNPRSVHRAHNTRRPRVGGPPGKTSVRPVPPIEVVVSRERIEVKRARSSLKDGWRRGTRVYRAGAKMRERPHPSAVRCNAPTFCSIRGVLLPRTSVPCSPQLDLPLKRFSLWRWRAARVRPARPAGRASGSSLTAAPRTTRGSC